MLVRDSSFCGVRGHLQSMHLQVKNLFVPDNSRVTLLQFSCDKLKNEIMNEIVDKAEHLLRTDPGYSSLQLVLEFLSVWMNLFDSINCDEIIISIRSSNK